MNSDQNNRELKKLDNQSLGNEQWALCTISSSLHGGRMGASLAMFNSKGGMRHKNMKNQVIIYT